MYADVYLPIAVNHTFSYLIPKKLENTIKKGALVHVPFINGYTIGYVNNIVCNKKYPGKIKSIDSLFSNILINHKDLSILIDWMSKYYLTPKGIILKKIFSFLFQKKKNKKEKAILITESGKNALKQNKINGNSRIKILQFISKKKNFIRISTLKNKINFSTQTLNSLLRDKYIKVKELSIDFNPIDNISSEKKQLELSLKQNKIFSVINDKIGSNQFSTNLIHGITGSGKTEVYIKLIEKIVQQNKSALVLVPEIILTPEIAKRFKSYFQNQVGIWNSDMTYSEKKWTWNNLIKDKIKIIIGTRSAIFLPIKNLQIIIVDEEHDSSYKQSDGMPSYNARDIAIIRAKNLKIPVVLGSATPSIESYYNSISKKYNYFELKERYGNAAYPNVELIDMFREKNKDQIFSKKLLSSIKICLEKKEQIILLHNRRGFASMLYCTNCGHVFTSSKTSVPLTYHKMYNQLLCHHTEEKYSLPTECFKCNSVKLEFKGIGTEKIEHEINKFFPNTKILRFDSDSTLKKNSYKEILRKFEEHKAEILIGTQMVSKGFDFHNVTLVGVLNADIGLFSPDFKSGEKIFQLLYQVCGRSGRGNKKGKAIIQSFNTEDPYISYSTIMDTKKYYNTLLADRLELNYPPFSKIIRILLKSKNLNILEKKIHSIAKILKKKDFIILGPALAPIEKINNFYRYHMIIKTKNPIDFQKYYRNEKTFQKLFSNLKNIHYQIDVDPNSLL